MSQVQEIVGGAHFAQSYSGDGSALTSLTRANLSAGTANSVCVNNGSGQLSDIPLLDPARGGTGIDTSAATGLAKITAGVWSAGAVIVNGDISPTAAIARSKLAAGTANSVCINNGSGVLTDTLTLSTALGGTNADLSGVVGPAVITVAGGVGGSVNYSTAATASTVVQRDGTGQIFGTTGQWSAGLLSNSLAPFSGTTIALGAGTTILNNSLDYSAQIISPSSFVRTYARGATTTNATPTTILLFPTSANTGYTIYLHAIARRGDTGNVATFRTVVRAKNTGGTVSSTNVELTRSREVGLSTTTAQPVVSGINLDFQVVGMAATTVQWAAEIVIVGA
jgi:hypothetical protein